MGKEKEQKVIRIQDDLYEYANGEWMASAKIPSDLPAIDAFTELHLAVEKKLMEDFDRLSKDNTVKDIPALDDALKLYQKALDVDAREKAGMTPIFPLLEKIKNIKNFDEFNALGFELLKDNVNFPFQVIVNEDVRDTTKQCLVIMDPDTILPDKGLYDKKIVKFFLMKFYKKMMVDLLKLSPLSKAEQKQYLKDAIKFDDILRKYVKTPTENADYVKLFNIMTVDEVDSLLKPLDLKGLLEQAYQDKAPKDIDVGNPAFVKAFKDILNNDTFELFIHWAYINTIRNYAPMLSKTIKDISDYYLRKLVGIKEQPTIEKQAFRLVSATYSEPIGLYYGRTYFGEKAKEDITSITQKIIDTYKVRMENNTFLTEETKAKAITKLSAIKIKMGYPDKYDELYDKLKVSDDDLFFDAMNRIRKVKFEHELKRILEATDHTKWLMPAHMVNACYDPFKNDVTFPAAILQKPFYDVNQSREENLGGIGAVIGHEISHAFDNNGSHLDEKGCLNDWWKEEDFKKFEELTNDMIEQFDSIIYHGNKANGKLIVSENIADNGGMAVTLQIMKDLDNADYQKYFTNWGRIWRQKASENYIKMVMKLDVHAPNGLRANVTPRNFSEWYQAFDVKETDKMFIEEGKRISIW